MTASNIGLGVLSFVVGWITFPAYTWSYWKIARYAKGNFESANKTQALIILATIVACTFCGAVILVPFKLLDLIPLGSRYGIFSWFWLLGAAACRLVEANSNRLTRVEREKRLHASIQVEIDERLREKRNKQHQKFALMFRSDQVSVLGQIGQARESPLWVVS